MCGCNSGSVASRQPNARAAAVPSLLNRTVAPPGIPQEGDVLARTLFDFGAPIGGATGRRYNVQTRGEDWFVAPEDIAANPGRWSVVV